MLDAGDILAAEALEQVGYASRREPDAAVFYSDEDEILPDGRRRRPCSNPNGRRKCCMPSTILDVSRSCSGPARRNRGRRIFAVDGGAGAEWNLHLRVADGAAATGRKIGRIPGVLCHRIPGGDRDRPAPGTAAAEEHRAALRGFWADRGIQATVETQPDGTQRSSWDIADPPLVSIIMPHREGSGMLQRCLDSVLMRTQYPNIEVIIVESASDELESQEFHERHDGGQNVRVIRASRWLNHTKWPVTAAPLWQRESAAIPQHQSRGQRSTLARRVGSGGELARRRRGWHEAALSRRCPAACRRLRGHSSD